MESNEPVEFRIVPNGPLQVKGNFTIIDTKGKRIEIKGEVILCRCGASKEMPFCDGSHKSVGVKN
jgi:CDGSH iron-sulfur domain-containing protein 3